MKKKLFSKLTILGLSILIGFTTLGYFIYKGLRTFSDKDRVVTVKGLAEMNMEATSSTISLNFTFSSDDLKELLAKSETKKKAILSYLKKNGYDKVQVNNIEVSDRERYYETQWRNGEEVQVKVDRYSVTQRLSVRLSDVKLTENKASQLRLDLISSDLTANISTSYSFPELNSIKPKLIAESTKNARVAGEQFANDSKAKLGKIKTASQGQITIAGNYYYYDEEESSSAPDEPYLQKARVVSTIVFFLE
jgi:uncharacterized protein